MAKKSIDLIDRMRQIAEATQPITGRGIGYKLFSAGLMPSMSRKDMQKVYRLLKEARERGIIPWEWIVDETRGLERKASWNDPKEYADAVINSFRRDYWDQQPVRVEVWSEKGTVRGVLRPVLDEYGIGFRVMHGFTSATTAHDVAIDDDGRPLIALYVGDWDPSGLWMSLEDLPTRMEKYEGDHVDLRRIALTRDQTDGLLSFPASDKQKDPRYKWFVRNFGDRCWELDALDPNTLRSLVENEVRKQIDFVAWDRCKVVEKAEYESLVSIMTQWKPEDRVATEEMFADDQTERWSAYQKSMTTALDGDRAA
jgi:hypothetical protein